MLIENNRVFVAFLIICDIFKTAHNLNFSRISNRTDGIICLLSCSLEDLNSLIFFISSALFHLALFYTWVLLLLKLCREINQRDHCFVNSANSMSLWECGIKEKDVLQEKYGKNCFLHTLNQLVGGCLNSITTLYCRKKSSL